MTGSGRVIEAIHHSDMDDAYTGSNDTDDETDDDTDDDNDDRAI